MEVQQKKEKKDEDKNPRYATSFRDFCVQMET
ncbi:hypothetical protein HHE06_01820 [Helicobacter heilmannii]|nr:hypothetical protein HHE014_10110 [Helicobacter heilmannii]CRF50357.1 hypothetical protein HHE06_01820 [Helicobacter heilmannii]